LPIVGWFVLGGRCRDCRAPISPRYPVVELLVAISSAAVCRSTIVPVGDAEAGLYTLDALVLGLRLLLVFALVCAALLEFDAHRAPLRLLVIVLAAGFALSVIWPGLRPPVSEAVSGRAYDCGRTLAAGLLLGLLAWPMLLPRADRQGVRDGVCRMIELGAVGMFLGVTAVAVISVFAATWCLASGMAGRLWRGAGRFGWAAALAVGTLIWIAAGSDLSERWLPSGGEDGAMTVATAGAVVAVLSIVARVVRGVRHAGPRAAGKGD
jgi:leader peptidase (prepilin peptidase)/N-methyltransferase